MASLKAQLVDPELAVLAVLGALAVYFVDPQHDWRVALAAAVGAITVKCAAGVARSPRPPRTGTPQLAPLSMIESVIAWHLHDGLDIAHIAAAEDISQLVVKKQMRHIYEKLDCAKPQEVVDWVRAQDVHDARSRSHHALTWGRLLELTAAIPAPLTLGAFALPADAPVVGNYRYLLGMSLLAATIVLAGVSSLGLLWSAMARRNAG